MRSAVGVTEVVSVAVLSIEDVSTTPLGAAMVAVLAMTPTADATTVAVTANVAVPAGVRDTVVLIALPDPAAGHDDPADAEHVHVTLPSDAGTTSAKGAPTTADGPELETTI